MRRNYNMEVIKIAIVDDHSMIREGLKQLLELENDLEVIGQAGDGIECMRMLETIRPDVIMLDLNMPNKNGIETLAEIKKKDKNQKVLILTIHNEVEYLYKSVEIGAEGYVLKDSDSFILKNAIMTVYNGRTYVESSLKPLLKDRMRRPFQNLYESNTKSEKAAKYKQLTAKKSWLKLTKREIQVLELLGEGLYNKEIAEKLNISEKTVKNHVSSIFKKIEVTDRTQAVVYAIRNNIIDVV